MALFKRTKEEKKDTTPSGVASAAAGGTPRGSADVLRNPRITEKATDHQSIGVYTFEVAEHATKRSVVAAISSLYNVTPRKIRIVRIPAKQKRSQRTGARGSTRRGKKAYVYLKKGDTITIA